MGRWDGGGYIKMRLSCSGREVPKKKPQKKPNRKWAPAEAHFFRKI